MNRLPVIVLLILLFSCKQEYIPKPYGYFRIGFPEKKYVGYSSECPFSFEYPVYSHIEKSNTESGDPCFMNVVFPGFNAKIHLSYKKIEGNLREISEECYSFVYKHSVKADAIEESVYTNSENRVFGILYSIKGNAASNIQFYATDSTGNFLRGALYFGVRPNSDSLAPVIEFIGNDIVNIIETLKWK